MTAGQGWNPLGILDDVPAVDLAAAKEAFVATWVRPSRATRACHAVSLRLRLLSEHCLTAADRIDDLATWAATRRRAGRGT